MYPKIIEYLNLKSNILISLLKSIYPILSHFRFFANVYIESHKTSDGIVREAIAEKNFRRTRLPQPRPIRELVGEWR